MQSDETRPLPDGPEDRQPRRRIELNWVQVIAAVAAAVSAAVAASALGVAGTIVGTAVVSIVATVGNALYTASLRRTRETLKGAQIKVLRRTGATRPAAGDAHEALGSVRAALAEPTGPTTGVATVRIPTQPDRSAPATGTARVSAAGRASDPDRTAVHGADRTVGHGSGSGSDRTVAHDADPDRTAVRGSDSDRTVMHGADSDRTAVHRGDSDRTVVHGDRTVRYGGDSERTVVRGGGPVRGAAPGTVYGGPTRRRVPRRALVLVGSTVLVFVLAFGVLTGIEALMGTSFSSLWGHGDSGSTAGALFDNHGGGRSSTDTTVPTPDRSARDTGSPTPTGSPDPTGTPGHGSSPAPSHAGSPSPTHSTSPTPSEPPASAEPASPQPSASE